MKYIFILIIFASCTKKYTCKTTTTYEQNPYFAGDKKIKDTYIYQSVNWREKRKLDGNQSSIYGNGLIIESKTNCY
jgi:hypothetical protein